MTDSFDLVIVGAGSGGLGAHVLSPGAGEIIGELALAVEQRMKLADLGLLVHAYPTYSSNIGLLAADAAYERAERWHWLVRKGKR